MRLQSILSFLLATATLCSVSLESDAHTWDEIPQADLDATSCPSDPNAPAEVLYKELMVNQEPGEVSYQRVKLRIKLYSEAGVDRFRKHKVRYSEHLSLRNLQGRVVKPSGEVLELSKDDVYKEVERKNKGVDLHSTTFSFPQVEVGDIVELDYKLVYDRNVYMAGIFLTFQEDWPIRKIDLAIKPYTGYFTEGIKWISFNCETNAMRKHGDGFYRISLENVEAYPKEPMQFPDVDRKSWIRFFNVSQMRTGDHYWDAEARRVRSEMNSLLSPGSAIKEKAKELTKGLSESSEKLTALYDFCRYHITNSVYGSPDAITAEQRQDIKRDDKPSRILKQGYGNPYNIMMLFGSLARAAGFEVEVASVVDRSKGGFYPSYEVRSAVLPHLITVVKMGEEWQFMNPGSKFLEAGELGWKNDGVTAMITEKRKAKFIKTPSSKAADSLESKTGRFELHADGSLTGSASFKATGNFNLNLKRELCQKSPAELKDLFEDEIQKTWPNAEIKSVESSDVNAPSEPLEVTCEVLIPNYAQVTGDRIIFQPSVFRKSEELVFTDPERKTDIFFDFPYSEQDKLLIKLPEGYEFESPSAPHPFAKEGVIKYEPKIQVRRKTNSIVYHRNFELELRHLPKEHYRFIKGAFDMVHRQDQHALTLKKI